MISESLKSIKNRIAAAARRANRHPDEIKLVAVCKRVPKDKIIEAVDCGHFIFGENYVQEAIEKIPRVKEFNPAVTFHFIGKLQSNKANKAAELFDVIETVDSIKLARALDKRLSILQRTLRAYVQVNVGGEKQKSGISPEESPEFLEKLQDLQNLKINGLMTMPPYFANPEASRPYFRKLKKLAEELASLGLLGKHGPVELSMGMSGDFEVAIEEGATVIRVGTALFGERKP